VPRWKVRKVLFRVDAVSPNRPFILRFTVAWEASAWARIVGLPPWTRVSEFSADLSCPTLSRRWLAPPSAPQRLASSPTARSACF
jgi:hypothetical protein